MTSPVVWNPFTNNFDYTNLSGESFGGTATTIGAITALISNGIPTADNTITTVNANIVGYDVTSGLAVGGQLVGIVKNIAGTVSIVGTPNILMSNDDEIYDAGFSLLISGTNILIQVTGTAYNGGADRINWIANFNTTVT